MNILNKQSWATEKRLTSEMGEFFGGISLLPTTSKFHTIFFSQC